MKLPADLVILSIPWQVREIYGGLSIIDDAWGYTDRDKHQIVIAAEQPYEARLETLMHEVIHILMEGRECCDLTKEDEVRTFSQVLTDTLLRNGIIPAI